MQLDITYDMRAPSFGAPARDLYAAALDQVQWADELGFDNVGLGEHHGSPDGYNPSPLVLAAAIGARSQRIHLRTSVLLVPFYDPIKLAPWTVEAFGKPSGPYAKDMTEDSVRHSGAYEVLTPSDALAMAEKLGPNSVLFLNPLLAGIDPGFSWQMLRLYEREVHPYLPRD